MLFFSLTADVIPKNIEQECALEKEKCTCVKGIVIKIRPQGTHVPDSQIKQEEKSVFSDSGKLAYKPLLFLTVHFHVFKGAVSRFYHDFERFKDTPRPYMTQQKWFYFGKHHSTNDNNPLESEDG